MAVKLRYSYPRVGCNSQAIGQDLQASTSIRSSVVLWSCYRQALYWSCGEEVGSRTPYSAGHLSSSDVDRYSPMLGKP